MLYITISAPYPNQSLPTNSADEAVLGLQVELIGGTSASPFMGAPYTSLIVAVLFLSVARISVEASLLWCAIVSMSCCASRGYVVQHDGKRRVLCGFRAAVSLLVLVVIELRSM